MPIVQGTIGKFDAHRVNASNNNALRWSREVWYDMLHHGYLSPSRSQGILADLVGIFRMFEKSDFGSIALFRYDELVDNVLNDGSDDSFINSLSNIKNRKNE